MKEKISDKHCSRQSKRKPKLLVLACTVMEREIRRFENGRIEFKFLDYGLHHTPENMAKALQEEIDRASGGDHDGIVLGYGLCSNGVVGVHSPKQTLVIPRIHDCITLFLGSPKYYREESTRQPGTYYLTPGWIEKGQTPLSKFKSYAKSYDEETARWVIHEEMKNYTRIALIDTGVYSLEAYRRAAQENAKFLGVSYEELRGLPQLFEALICGPWENNFLILKGGSSIQQEMFLEL
jgi:hypothetical protein